jgi:hypothetical protein
MIQACIDYSVESRSLTLSVLFREPFQGTASLLHDLKTAFLVRDPDCNIAEQGL